MKQLKAIIFDLDGTLYKLNHFSIKLVFSNLKQIMKMKDERNTRKEMRGISFHSKQEFYKHYLEKLSSKGHIKNNEAFYWYYNIYQDLMIKLLKKKYKLRNNINDVFDFLIKQDIKYVILSDYPKVLEKLKALNLKQSYINNCSLITSSDEFGCLKPSKQAFLGVLNKLKLKNDECLVVGDKYSTDIKGAINSDIPYIQIIENIRKKKYNYQMTFNEFYNFLINNELNIFYEKSK